MLAAAAAIRAFAPWRATSAAGDERVRAARLLARYGTDTLAPFALRSDKRYAFDPGGEAFLAYRVVAGVAIASGDPIGPPERVPALLRHFAADARRHGWIPAALAVSAGRLGDWRAAGSRRPSDGARSFR